MEKQNDLISRAALLEEYDRVHVGPPGGARKLMEKAPTVDAEPVRHGRWRHLSGDEWRCTVCGEVICTEGSWEKPTHKYCYECGAKMDEGVQNDQN